jgi:hypothetical protein
MVDFDFANTLASSDGVWTRSLYQLHGSFVVRCRFRHLERFNRQRRVLNVIVVLMKKYAIQRERIESARDTIERIGAGQEESQASEGPTASTCGLLPCRSEMRGQAHVLNLHLMGR